MGSVSKSQKRPKTASAWGSWQSASGVDYIDYTSDSRIYAVCYKISVSYGSSSYMDSLTVDAPIYCSGSLFAKWGTLRCMLYSSDPTGGSTLPSPFDETSEYIQCTSSEVTHSLTVSGLNYTGSTIYAIITFDCAYTQGSWVNLNSSNASVSASFYTPPAPTYYTVSTSAGTGIASTSGGGTYSSGSYCTVSCSLQSGYQFDGWYNGSTKVSSNQTYSFYVYGNVTLQARGRTPSYYVFVGAGDYVSSVSGGGQYNAGSICTVSAVLFPSTETEEYVFDGWYDDAFGTKLSSNNPYSFEVREMVSMTAYAVIGSRGNIRIKVGTAIVTATPYIYDQTNEVWQRYIPEVHNNNQWKISS